MTIDGKTAAFGHDARRLPTATTNALGTAEQVVSSSTYWKNGLLKQTTDARGQVADYYWTSAYKPAGVVFPNTGSTTNLYDEADRLVMSRDPEGNWATNSLDAVGRIVEATSSSLSVTNRFDAIGNLTNSVVDPSGLGLWIATEYDNLNRPASVSSALSVVQTQYDSLNRATNRIDAASNPWKTEYDALGRIRKGFRPSGSFEEYAYNALDARTGFWNADGNPMAFGVDAQGRVTSITNAIGKVTSFTFDDAGNLISRRDAEGAETQYGYNSLNRLVAITNEGVEVATFDHDPNGNLIKHEDSKGTKVEFEFDEMNRLVVSTSSVASVSSVVSYSYDLNGNRTHVTYPGGTNAVYVYGADNRLESVDLSAFGISTAFSFQYDSASRLTNIIYPNGINGSIGLDAEGRVVSIKHGSFVDRAIQRNALGYKTQEDIFAGLSPVPQAESAESQAADAADRITEQTLADTPDSTNATAFTYLHNDNGCLANIVLSATNVASFGYDYDNRISSVTSAPSVVSYIHDASGARIGRIAGGSPAVTNYFVVDYTDPLKRPLAETDASGSVSIYYVWAGMRLLCHIEANGDVYYYHADELGSTLALTDSNGNVTDEFAYMPYGYASHSGTNSTPFQWLGGYGVFYDSSTDLHLTLNRAYSSSLKRFVHPDPLGIDGGANVYAYANLNPAYFVDPTGEFGIVGAAVGGFVGALVGGGAAYIRGDSIWAGAAGGAVAGAFVGSGAGIVAGALGAGTLSAGGAFGTMALVGASGSMMGNATEQIIGSMESGQSFELALASVETKEQLVAGAIGGASGMVSGGGLVFNQAIRTASQQGNQMLVKHMVSISEELMANAPASQPTINAIQSQIMQSMSRQGLNTIQITTWSSAIFMLGTEVGEEFANPYNYPVRAGK